ncbi:MAG: hypothetical protein QXI16_04640, partial [Sulfolobaceae archaeon]
MLLSRLITGQIFKSLQVDKRGQTIIWLESAGAPDYNTFLKNSKITSTRYVYAPTQIHLDRTWSTPRVKEKRITTLLSTMPSTEISFVWDLKPLLHQLELRFGTYYPRMQFKTFVNDFTEHLINTVHQEKWLFLVTSADEWQADFITRSELIKSRLYLFYYFAAYVNKSILEKEDIENLDEADSIPMNVVLIVTNKTGSHWVGFCIDHNKKLLVNKFLAFLRQGVAYIKYIERQGKDEGQYINTDEQKQPVINKEKLGGLLTRYTNNVKVAHSVTTSAVKAATLLKKVHPEVDLQANINTVTKALHFASTGVLKEPMKKDLVKTKNNLQSHNVTKVPPQPKLNLKAEDINVFTETQTLTQQSIDSSIDRLPRKLESLNFTSVDYKIEDYKTSSPQKSTLSVLNLSFTKNKKEYNIKLLIPKIDQQNLIFIDGVPYQIRKVLMPDIISVPKPFYVRYDGLLAHFFISYRNYRKKNVFFIDIAKYTLPLTLVLYALVGPKTVHQYFKLPLLKESISKQRLTEIQTALLNTNSLLSITQNVNDQATYTKSLDQFTDIPNFYGKLASYIKGMNDPLTLNYCKKNGIKFTFIDIIAYMLNLCLSGSPTSLTSLDDLVLQSIDDNIIKVVFTWLNMQEKRELLSLSKSTLASDALITYLRNHRMLVPADSTNPVSSLKETTTVVYSHLNEGSLSHRDYNTDNEGRIDPIDTPVKDDIGLTQRVTAGAIVLNDKILTTKKDYPYSVSTSLVPWTSHNDGIRLMMALSHARQAVPLVVPDAPLIQTSFEQVAQAYSPYVIKSPSDGVVISVNPLVIKIQKDLFRPQLLPQVTTNKGLVTYSPIVSLNQKVKAGEIVAVSNEFHRKGPLTLGKTLYTAYLTTTNTFEDALAINKNVAPLLASKEANKIQLVLTEDQTILHIEQDKVLRGKPACIIARATTSNLLNTQLLDLNFIEDRKALTIITPRDSQ